MAIEIAKNLYRLPTLGPFINSYALMIDTAGGLKVIHTPGHTAGHISLLHLESETLITGDSSQIP